MKVKTERSLFFLQRTARQLRENIIRISSEYGNGHIAPALSTVEILVTLYYEHMKEKDQFVLSKGHGCLGLFAVLQDLGYAPCIAGHPDIDCSNGIHCTSGSLGHGIAVAAGKALARKVKHIPGTIYVLVGDGECQEGSVWETINIARRFQLHNFVIIIDHNKLQALDSVKAIQNETDLAAKFLAFGAHVVESDGHDCDDLLAHLRQIKGIKGKPSVIIAHTVKGKGISFMENDPKWHVRPLNDEERKRALKENAHA